MNVLEKVLEEIKDNAKLGNMRWESIRIEKVEEIIRSHMDDIPDTNVGGDNDTEEKIRVHIAECLHRIDNIRSFVGSKEHVNNDEKCIRNIEILKTSIAALEEYLRLKKKNGNDGWIPVSERLPKPYKLVEVTVHCSEWISDYDSAWVPENEKIHHDEEHLVSMGYIINALGDWVFFDMNGCEIYCDKEFGTDKGCLYSVVTAWRPFEELGPHKGGTR